MMCPVTLPEIDGFIYRWNSGFMSEKKWLLGKEWGAEVGRAGDADASESRVTISSPNGVE